MPFESDAQRRYLWSQKPEVAKKFAEHEDEGVVGRAIRSMKDFVTGEYGRRKERDRLQPPANLTGPRG